MTEAVLSSCKLDFNLAKGSVKLEKFFKIHTPFFNNRREFTAVPYANSETIFEYPLPVSVCVTEEDHHST